MHKYRSEGIEERTRLIYDLGLQNDYHNTTLTGEAYMIDITHKVCDFIDKYHRQPNKRSKNSEEKKLGAWLVNMKGRKKNRRYVYYSSIELVASERGYPDLFLHINKQQKAIDMALKVCDFIDTYKKIPSTGSKNTYEKSLAIWINNMKNARQGISNGILYKSVEDIVKNRGYHNLFNRLTDEQIAIDIMHKICDFIDTYNRIPSQRSKDPVERKFGTWIVMRKCRKNVLFPIIESIAVERGYPSIFESIDYKSESIDMITKLCDFIDTYNRIPSQRSKDPVERKLSTWFYNKKRAKKGNGSGKGNKMGVFYEVIEIIAIERGYPNMFNANWRDDLRK